MLYVIWRVIQHKLVGIMPEIEINHSEVLVEEEEMLGQIRLLHSEEDHHSSGLQEDLGEIVIITIIRTTKEEETEFSLVCIVATPIIGLV